MKNRFLLFILFTLGLTLSLFAFCDIFKKTNPATYDKGVVINGVRWATRNVDEPGTFAQKPESAGKFYQWNRKKAYFIPKGDGTDWNDTIPEGKKWKKPNDPSPKDWRVPTLDEIKSLLDEEKVSSKWIAKNGVKGRKFTDRESGNTLFLPAVGCLYFAFGTLDHANIRASYWTSTPHEKHEGCAYYCYSFDYLAHWHYEHRCSGHNIRCVAE